MPGWVKFMVFITDPKGSKWGIQWGPVLICETRKNMNTKNKLEPCPQNKQSMSIHRVRN